jgi:transposase
VDRGQATLFPESLEDWIVEDNPVRVIDVFVDELDLAELRFSRVDPEATGRPSYHPSVLLKLYIYGYLNRVQSSRRLEREAGRNVEVMWLTGRLVPDHKTIADFRKDNGKAIRQVSLFRFQLADDLREKPPRLDAVLNGTRAEPTTFECGVNELCKDATRVLGLGPLNHPGPDIVGKGFQIVANSSPLLIVANDPGMGVDLLGVLDDALGEIQFFALVPRKDAGEFRGQKIADQAGSKNGLNR